MFFFLYQTVLFSKNNNKSVEEERRLSTEEETNDFELSSMETLLDILEDFYSDYDIPLITQDTPYCNLHPNGCCPVVKLQCSCQSSVYNKCAYCFNLDEEEK